MPAPMHPHRRQSDYHYQYAAQNHSPVPNNNYYGGYPQAPFHGHPHQYVAGPPQWYGGGYQHQQQHQHQHYVPQHRQYQQSHAPVVVSSHPHLQSPSAHRQMMTTPPIVHSHMSPAPAQVSQPLHTVSPTPPTPSVSSNAPTSPTTPRTEVDATTPPATSTSTNTAASTPPSKPVQQVVSQLPAPIITHRMPFAAPLPWFSKPDEPFPARAPRRRRKQNTTTSNDNVELPALSSQQNIETDQDQEATQENTESTATPVSTEVSQETSATEQVHQVEQNTPPTPSVASVVEPQKPRAPSHNRTSTIPAVPVLPLRPAVPQGAKTGKPTAALTTPINTPAVDSKSAEDDSAPLASPTSEQTTTVASPSAKPKSWAELVRVKGAAAPAPQAAVQQNGAPTANGLSPSKTGSLTDVLSSYTVDSEKKLAFLEPRGLVNTGNMCYMNSILQTLVFCVPFYDFLDQVGKRAAHSFKSDTPLVDAMIMFLREFNVIDSAISVEQLRMRLKDTELEQYGDAFTPEYVYEVIRRLPRFAHMRRGHQQDAEEFLGFLLAGLHDECAQVIGTSTSDDVSIPDTNTSTATSSTDAGWMEVGPKQKSAITRSSGSIDIESPITKIFGGKLRSEFRVPGAKTSVTLEPYQPLQLDIGAPNVSNIVDALKGLTQSETIQGDFNSPRGPGKSAIKQVFIETLPPVLILHLKRFQYDNAGGTQKIWKKVGYPLELEIPKEVFPPTKRGGMAAFGGLPKYRLIGVVYHHGKTATGGHYTVDVRRQEGREWVRIDDTVIRRIRSEDVAESGSEEDPKLLAAALEQHKHDQSKSRNMYEFAGLDEEQEQAEDGVWKDANAPASRKWAGVVNGTATPSTTGKRTPKDKGGFKDNKVAYILFYQQVTP